jgi:riboflavin synthase
MFTGLVEVVGAIARLEPRGQSARVRVDVGELAAKEPLVLGESISVNGACLTVQAIVAGGFEADLSSETLARTTLGELRAGSRVNLERATPLGGRMGGHMVLGHVDATARVSEARLVGDAQLTVFEVGREMAPYLAFKGSVAIEGVSLTVNALEDAGDQVRFSVMLVPHTLAQTTLPALKPGARVNVEADVLARYIERQLKLLAHPGGGAGGPGEQSDRSLLEKLRSGGYM